MTILLLIVIAFVVVSKTRVPLGKSSVVLSMYLGILILSVGVFYFIADAEETLPPSNSPYMREEIDWESANRLTEEFYEAAHEGSLGQFQNAHVNGQWLFEFSGERLDLNAPNGYLSNMVVIERKENNDGVIEVTSYSTSVMLDGTSIISPPEIRLSGDRIDFLPPQPTIIELFQFFPDFTITQFTEDSMFGGFKQGPGMYWGNQALHLRIPSNLQLEQVSEMNIFYVEKERSGANSIKNSL